MTKSLTITALLITAVLNAAIAQKKNTVEISLGGYRMPNALSYDHGIATTVSLQLGRKINDKIELTLGYIFPNANGILSYGTGRQLCEEESLDSYADIGKLFYRNSYHYWDVAGHYKIYAKHNHSLGVFQALSLSFGTNVYLKNVGAIAVPDNPFHVLFTEYESKKEFYLGGVTGVEYDYTFWKNRVNIGAAFVGRYYLNHFPFQINYSIHVGYNF